MCQTGICFWVYEKCKLANIRRENEGGPHWVEMGFFSFFFIFFSLGSENADISTGETGEEKNTANNIHTTGLILLLMEVTLFPLEYTEVLPFSPKTDVYEPKSIGLEDISWISMLLPQLLQEHVMIPIIHVPSEK